MNEKKGCSKMGFGHLKWMLLLIGAAVAASFAFPSTPWIVTAILLLCPLMMVGMMIFMHRGHSHGHDAAPPHKLPVEDKEETTFSSQHTDDKKK